MCEFDDEPDHFPLGNRILRVVQDSDRHLCCRKRELFDGSWRYSYSYSYANGYAESDSDDHPVSNAIFYSDSYAYTIFYSDSYTYTVFYSHTDADAHSDSKSQEKEIV